MRSPPICALAVLAGTLLALPPAGATGLATCDSGPKAQWQPVEKLEQQLKDKGWTVRRIKEDGGCYEVYALNEKGERGEYYFHPVTLAPVPTTPAPLMQPVWSPWLRLLHWVLAASTIASFATHEGGGRWHEWLGYTALAAAALRTVLGFALGGYAAFGQFVRGVTATWAYTRAVWRRAEPRYLGHNPLGGWMVVLILANSLATGLTGWLYTTDRFWGVAWLEDLHGALGHAFIPLVLLHVAGVVFTSWRHRENLVAAMLHGRKRPAEPGDMA